MNQPMKGPQRPRGESPPAAVAAADPAAGTQFLGFEDGELQSLFDELQGSDATISIYQSGGGNVRDSGFCETVEAGRFTTMGDLLTYIRDEWGPGKYQLQLRKGGKIVTGGRAVTIAANRSARAVPARAGTVEDGAQKLIDQMREDARRSEDRYTRLLETLVGKAAAPAPPPLGLAELVTLVKLVSDRPAAPGGDSLGQFSQFVELGKNLGILKKPGDSDGGGTADPEAGLLTTAVKELGPVLAALIAAKGAEPAPARPQPLPPPRPAQQPAAPAAATSPAGIDADPLAEFRAQLAVMLRGAERNSDPIGYATVICDQIDETLLRGLIDAPQFVEVLAGVDPRVLDHREWFEELRQEVRAILDQPPEPEAEASQVDSEGGHVD